MNDTSKFEKIGDCNKITDLLTTDNTDDESDELFSDDEQEKEIKCRSYVSQDTSVSSRSETPLSLLDSFTVTTPTAVVPSAPLSLMPFLNKINEQWTSDLETPQAQPHTKLSPNTEETPKSEQRTPDNFTVKSDKITSDSPVIVSKVTRRYPKRRRIFRSSISVDPLAVTSDENNTTNIGIEKLPSSEDTSVQDDIINIATSTSYIDNILEDNKPNIPSEIQDTNSNIELEEVKNVPDNLNTSTQEFFKNASFSNIDELCLNNFDRPADKATQCNQSIGKAKQSNIEENKNIGFSTARGASINISEQALFKAKELLKDAFEDDEMHIENCDKRNFNEQQDKYLPSSSFTNNASHTEKEVSYQAKPQFIEQIKNVDKLNITNYKKSIMNKSPAKIDVAPVSFSIASGASTNISKGTLSKAQMLLMAESDKNTDEIILMKYGKKSPLNRNFIKQSNIASFSTATDKTTSISKKSLPQAKILFTEQLDTIVELETFNKIDTSDKMQCDMKISNIGFCTARGTSINISEQALSKAKALFEEQLEDPLEPIIAKEILNDDNKIKIQEEKTQKIGFQTAHDKPVNISEALFAEFDDTSAPNIVGETSIHNKEEKTTAVKIPNVQTARGTFINISALSTAETLFAEEFDDASITTEKTSDCNKGNKELESKVSNFGFQTARGTSINISEQALSKAKTLFAGELDDTSTATVTEKISGCTKEGKELEATVSSFRFQTARGTSINISEQALSKAKTLFSGELDDMSTATVAEKISGSTKESKELEATVSSLGFQTARGTSINVSKQALSKAKTLFAEELDDTSTATVTEKISGCTKEGKELEATVSSFGFQTARGTSINISEQALSKAKTLFAGELDDTSTVTAADKASGYKGEGKQLEAIITNFGFQSARGASINISEQALSKAKTLFAGELDDTSTLNVAEKISGSKKGSEDVGAKVSSFGFQTARGTSVNISERALSEAESLFADELNDPMDIDIADNNEDVKGRDFTSPYSEIQTANDQRIAVLNNSALKKHALVSNYTIEDSPDVSNVLLQKRKLCEINSDESTPLSKNCASEVKKARLSNKFQGKELFPDSNVDIQSETIIKNFGFQSARGASINISEQALSKAKTLFAGELDDTSTPNVAEKISGCKKGSEDAGAKVSSFGFQTARGTSVNISERALSEAESLFADELNDPMDIDIADNNEDVKGRDFPNTYSEIQTANDQRITVSNNAALEEHELVSKYTVENIPNVSNVLLQKRKLCEINSDESTPLSRNCASEVKKARLSNEFQGRELFPDSDVDMDNDEDFNSKGQVSSFARLASGSPQIDTEETSRSHAVGSPIIGGKRMILRKIRSSEYRRVKSRAAKVDKMDTENVSSNEMVRGNASPKRSDDGESNVRTQPTTENKESSEYGDSQTMMIFIDESTKILQDRLAAALEQEKIITAKRRCGSKQSVGHLYLYKQTNLNARLSLREISNGAPPVPRSYQELIDRRIQPSILSITAATAAHYELRCSDFYGDDMARSNVHGIEMGDNARLIMNENGHVGIWEFLRAFLASPGVDPNLVPARWVENHYRWIVWKLASMDRMKFGSAELPRALTPSRIMAQLKYRYDREIDRSQRPAIRRILEKDDVASKRMILCVSSIVENNNVSMEVGRSPHVGIPKWKMELTDGWYSISACIDVGMVRSVSTGKIKEGTKLVVSGAELLNCDQGCHPLEAPIDVCLKLHTNSTRRARWDAKLGYAPRSGPIPIRLRDVCPNGGSIGELTIIVTRVYPMLYHERTASGESIMRNAKCEEKAQSKHEQQCLSDIETFYAKAEKDFEGGDFSCEDDVQRADYETLSTEHASEKRHELLQELRQREERFKRELQSKLRESLPGPRQVSPLLKVRVCDGNANAILSIWSPSEEVVDAVKEGACVSLCNVAASGKRGNELQLTAGRSAVFKPGKMHNASYPVRVCTSLCEIADSEFAPPYGEFDTVGFVCSSGPAPYGMKDFEVVHLARPKANSNESSYLSILFWHGIASYGYAEILTVGSIVACSNLEWRRAASWNIPVAYCTDRSTFTRNPRRNYLHESFESLRDLIRNPIQYAEECTSVLNVKLQKKSTPTRYESGKNTPIKMYDSTTSSVDKKLVDHASPLSTPKLGAGGSYIASRPSIQRRLEKLQYYDRPPELSPIVLTKSKRVSLDFRSPIRLLDVSSNKDAPSTSNQSKGSSNTLNKQ